MKPVLALATALVLLADAGARAQEKPAKADRKTLTFQPGAKVPDQIAAALPVHAATTTPAPMPKGPAEIVDAFFGLLQKSDIDTAYAGLTKGSKIAERPEELRALKAKTNEAIEVFGAMRGYDLIENKPVGERLVRATYVSLGKEFPLRWRFYFYKAEDEWKLIDLRVDDKLTGIFDEPEEAKPVEKP